MLRIAGSSGGTPCQSRDARGRTSVASASAAESPGFWQTLPIMRILCSAGGYASIPEVKDYALASVKEKEVHDRMIVRAFRRILSTVVLTCGGISLAGCCVGAAVLNLFHALTQPLVIEIPADATPQERAASEAFNRGAQAVSDGMRGNVRR